MTTITLDDGRTVQTPVDRALIDHFSKAGWKHKGSYMNNGKDYGEDHNFTNKKLGLRIQVKGTYASQDWKWCYGLNEKSGKFVWCGCDFLTWEHCAKVLFAVSAGAKTPGVDALNDPLRSHYPFRGCTFELYVSGMFLSGGEDWTQHKLCADDFPEGFHFSGHKRAAILQKILAVF